VPYLLFISYSYIRLPKSKLMTAPFSLTDKVLIVTGGTGILGQAFVDDIEEAGGAVGMLGGNADEAQVRAEAIDKQGSQALALVADVLDEAHLRAACRQALDVFGHIDGLVNVAGGSGPAGVPDPAEDVFTLNLAAMKRVMELNLWGAVLPTQVFDEALAQAPGRGSIVTISSMNSKRAITKVLVYNMGKAALNYYNQWFAVEMANRYGDKLRMNALAPGFFLTEQNRALLTTFEGGYTGRGELVIRQTPFKRFGHPDELKGTLVWLLSDASQFVTGSMLCVDSGFSSFDEV
jgi:NAD(P)-dependent dehydrogenase (short-subunit alcohol dehydrogenase family)